MSDTRELRFKLDDKVTIIVTLTANSYYNLNAIYCEVIVEKKLTELRRLERIQ